MTQYICVASMKFPLKYLAFYLVKKDFNSAGDSNISFSAGQLLQYQKTVTNIYDGIEMVSWLDWNTKEKLIWNIDSETLYENWNEYLEPTQLSV